MSGEDTDNTPVTPSQPVEEPSTSIDNKSPTEGETDPDTNTAPDVFSSQTLRYDAHNKVIHPSHPNPNHVGWYFFPFSETDSPIIIPANTITPVKLGVSIAIPSGHIGKWSVLKESIDTSDLITDRYSSKLLVLGSYIQPYQRAKIDAGGVIVNVVNLTNENVTYASNQPIFELMLEKVKTNNLIFIREKYDDGTLGTLPTD